VSYRVTKTYDHSLGLSACFRQWRAASHCRHLHGYALAFEFVFEAEELDDRNWVVDFGGLKQLKHLLEQTFDHKLVVAGDDPYLDEICQLAGIDVASVTMFPDGVGCEKFAEYAFGLAKEVLCQLRVQDRVKVVSCECREHGGNSATYQPSK
jgi:6-pyruvoyltetrahydropterin/6-carboxytetrahydropterin synthase